MKKTIAIILVTILLFLTACQKTTTSSDDAGTPTTVSDKEYIGNKNNGKLHYYTCNQLPAEKNRVYFSSEEEANENGYTEYHNKCMSEQN